MLASYQTGGACPEVAPFGKAGGAARRGSVARSGGRVVAGHLKQVRADRVEEGHPGRRRDEGRSVSAVQTERCPGCRAELPKISGPTHRYIGASPACWAIFSDLLNAGEPPIAPAPTNALIGDAYAAQHPGTPSDQAIQSVAVHLLVLHGVIARGVDPASALWIRRRALREDRTPRRGRFRWLEPPSFEGSSTVSDVAGGQDPVERAERAREYVHGVWSLWRAEHGRIISEYYDAYVVPDAP